MNKIAKRSMVFFLVAALAFIPFTTSALAQSAQATQDNSAGGMTIDLLMVRPVGLAALVLGSAVFVAGLPFSLLGGNTAESAQKLVAKPAKYTFKRPLGDF